jgi:hypothetical protein
MHEALQERVMGAVRDALQEGRKITWVRELETSHLFVSALSQVPNFRSFI